MMTPAETHFGLFGLPPRFALDLESLSAAWREVQVHVHPDRFVTAAAAEKRVAMQWATRANDAYRVLKDPLSRAAYLCDLAGHPIQAETNTSMSAAFLTRQMLWREALEDAAHACDPLPLQQLAQQVEHDRSAALIRLADLLDLRRAYPEAAVQVRELMFIDKFANELASARERLSGLDVKSSGASAPLAGTAEPNTQAVLAQGRDIPFSSP